MTLNLSLSSIRDINEAPYKSAIAAKAKLVMASWAIYPALDAEYRRAYPRRSCGGELRNRLKSAASRSPSPRGRRAQAVRLDRPPRHARGTGRHGPALYAGHTDKEGTGATNSLAFDYTHNSLNAADFKASVERMLALRATLPG